MIFLSQLGKQKILVAIRIPECDEFSVRFPVSTKQNPQNVSNRTLGEQDQNMSAPLLSQTLHNEFIVLKMLSRGGPLHWKCCQFGCPIALKTLETQRHRACIALTPGCRASLQ